MPTHYQGTEQERTALDAYIKLTRATESVNQQLHTHLHEHNLTISQFGVLEALYHLGPMPVGQVAEKILRSSANLTLVIDNLVKRGLVHRERRASDRRSVEVSLTDEGRSLIARLMPDHVARIVRAFAALSPDEQKRLAALCRELGLSQGSAARTTDREATHDD
jgi:MarR family 2-MHQ and catechol resistance regulon transcriptional repressor